MTPPPEKLASDEILRQIQVTRQQTGNGGEIHYHLRSADGQSRAGRRRPRAIRAVRARAASPWIAATPPLTAKTHRDHGQKFRAPRWENAGVEPPRWWLLQCPHERRLDDADFPGEVRPDGFVNNAMPDAVSIRAVDRLGNLSEPAVWAPKNIRRRIPVKGAENEEVDSNASSGCEFQFFNSTLTNPSSRRLTR